MVRRLREIVAPGCWQVFFLVIAASLMWASPAASVLIDEDLVITRGNFSCDGGVSCTIADIPKVFAQACKVTGGTLSGNQCRFNLPADSELFGTSDFLVVAVDIFEAHLLEQAKAAAA